MIMKSCSNCSEPAQYSLVFVLSSIGMSPRLQKCSPAVSFCNECLQELCETACLASNDLQNAVNRAYTAINERVPKRSTAEDRITD